MPLIQAESVLISTVPARIIQTDALVARLSHNDVTFISDHIKDYEGANLEKLMTMKNVTLYPGIAYLSDEARIAKQEIFLGNMTAYLEGKVQNRVN